MWRACLAVALIAGGIVWLRTDQDFGEGPVLITFTPHRGLVTADLLAIPPFAIAAWLLWKAR